MNILFVSTAYIEPGKPSTGLPNYLRRVSYALTEKNHKVIILYCAGYNQIRYDRDVEVVALRVPQLHCEDEVLEIERRSMITSYYLNEKVEEIVKEKKIDIVQFTSLEGIGRLYHSSVPAVLRLSSYHKTYFSSELTYRKDIVEAYSKAERESSNAMDRIYAPCAITAEVFGRDINRSVDIIETPFENDVRQEDFSFYNKNLKGLKYVLFFGSMYAEKGILIISETLKRFLERNESYYFVAIGDILRIKGDTADSILYRAAGEYQERVRVFDPITHDKLYPVIKNADFVILPSLMDNLPNACIEAMYFGKIVIGTKGASFDQIIEDGNNGFLCKIGDAESLLDKMSYVVSLEENVKKTIGEKAHERIEKLNPENIVAQLIEYYRTVIDDSADRSDKINAGNERREECRSYIMNHKEEIDNTVVCQADKYYLQNRILMQWLINKQQGIYCSEYLNKKGYKTVAVYGVFDLGKMLIDELLDNGVKVVYGVDRKKRTAKVPVYSPSDTLPKADVMIITAISSQYEIKEVLKGRFGGDIVSLEDCLFL